MAVPFKGRDALLVLIQDVTERKRAEQRLNAQHATTNALAEYPTSKPATPGCVLSTMYHVLGIDHTHAFIDPAQRPMPILSEGEPVKELIG